MGCYLTMSQIQGSFSKHHLMLDEYLAYAYQHTHVGNSHTSPTELYMYIYISICMFMISGILRSYKHCHHSNPINMSHMLLVWNIYLDLPLFFQPNVGNIFHTWSIWVYTCGCVKIGVKQPFKTTTPTLWPRPGSDQILHHLSQARVGAKTGWKKWVRTSVVSMKNVTCYWDKMF